MLKLLKEIKHFIKQFYINHILEPKKEKTMKYKRKLVVVRTNAGWHWRECAMNGCIVSSSEKYSSKSKAMQTARVELRLYKVGVCKPNIEILDKR